MRVAMMGTRGVPAHYGGFETAIEEIGRRLVDRGHSVTVYCRRPADGEPVPARYLGMDLVTLPALRSKSLETLSHTAISTLHLLTREKHDAVLLFNSANSVFVPPIRLRRIPVAVHVDGLEWKRSKWSGAGQRYYRMAESLSVRWADALIADAQGIADYYRAEFGATTEMIAYGAPILNDQDDDRVRDLGLLPGGFHLVVARFEPENNIEMIVRGYCASDATHPLVVVGSAPYNDSYTRSLDEIVRGDERVKLLGAVWDQQQLDQLYSHATTYLHGHSVGGTNPSLLRAMGAGAAVSAFDVTFNREVLGPKGWFFGDEADVAELVEAAESDPSVTLGYGDGCRERASLLYRWDDVTDGYESLINKLRTRWTRRGEVSGRRMVR